MDQIHKSLWIFTNLIRVRRDSQLKQNLHLKFKIKFILWIQSASVKMMISYVF